MSALPPQGPDQASTRRRSTPPDDAHGSARFVARTPVDAAPLLASLAAHAVPGVEVVDGATVTRVVHADGGPVVVTAELADGRVELRGDLPVATLRTLAHRWFGLDDDLDAVAAAFADDPVVGPLVARRPDVRVLGHLDGFEATVTTVLGQQVTLAAARTFSGRLAAAWGRPGPGALLTFPRPADLAAVDPRDLQAAVRITTARARTLHAVAVAFADGLEVAPGVDPVETRRRLLALPGIGPWTVEYLALRVLADRDALPAGDVVLRRALGVEGTRDVEAAAAPWRPWRAFAAIHLWTAHAYAL